GYLTRKHLEEQGIKVHHPDQSKSRSRSPNTPSSNNDGSRSLNSSNVQIDQQKQPDILKDVIRLQETATRLSKQGELSASPLISKASSDVDVAASKIQAGVRGFLTRKHLEEKGLKVHHPLEKRTRSGSACVPEIRYEAKEKTKMKTSRSYEDFLKSGVEDEKRHVENAASKIQAGIRGFLTRKHLNEQGLPVRSPHEIAQQAGNRKESLVHDFPPVHPTSKNETPRKNILDKSKKNTGPNIYP
uniref:Uncharacterized protein n=1 Tax=Romanomermis culicivorax TaxID=13658 RepID=A0A915IG31_ROMCU